MSNRVRVAIAIVALVGLAGCLGTFAGADGGEPGPIDQVPDDVEMVINIDTSVTADEQTLSILDAFDTDESVADEIADAKTEFESETGLDADAASNLLLFALESDDGSVGDETAFIVSADWDEDELIEAMSDEENTEYDETDHEGATLYEPTETDGFGEPLFVGVLDDGTYVIGDKAAVTASLDVEQGVADPLSGELREAYDSVEPGYLTYAMEGPDEELSEEDLPEDAAELDTSSFEAVTVIAGSYYTSDDDLGTEMRLQTDSETAAMDVADVSEGAVSLVRGLLPEDHEDLKDELRAVEIDRDGTVVTVSFEGDAERIAEAIENADFDQDSDVGFDDEGFGDDEFDDDGFDDDRFDDDWFDDDGFDDDGFDDDGFDDDGFDNDSEFSVTAALE